MPTPLEQSLSNDRWKLGQSPAKVILRDYLFIGKGKEILLCGEI